jgi:hypothetical protein
MHNDLMDDLAAEEHQRDQQYPGAVQRWADEYTATHGEPPPMLEFMARYREQQASCATIMFALLDHFGWSVCHGALLQAAVDPTSLLPSRIEGARETLSPLLKENP